MMTSNTAARHCYLELALELEEDDQCPLLELQKKIKKDDDE
jgi:hypothetical protein